MLDRKWIIIFAAFLSLMLVNWLSLGRVGRTKQRHLKMKDMKTFEKSLNVSKIDILSTNRLIIYQQKDWADSLIMVAALNTHQRLLAGISKEGKGQRSLHFWQYPCDAWIIESSKNNKENVKDKLLKCYHIYFQMALDLKRLCMNWTS